MLDGDQWKYAKEPAKSQVGRAGAQATLNEMYVLKQIDREDWRARTDKLSEPMTEDYASVLA